MSSSTLNLGPYLYTPRKFLDETRMSKLWIAFERTGARQGGDDPEVTLKIARMTEEKFSYANQRAIENEERWLMKLRHPNIVKLRPIAEAEGNHRDIYRARSALPGQPWFLVIDYLPGGDLKHLMDQSGVLSASLALQIAQHLGRAVIFVHKNGCIHCDLKSRNVLFREQPGKFVLSAESEPILIDFGIAKDAGDGPQRVTGTPAWMPPEAEISLRAGDKLSPSPNWDTYALGLILYNIVTGKPPRLGRPSDESWERIAPEQFSRDPSVSDPVALTTGLNQLIEQAVSDRPHERLTARQFTEQVKALRPFTLVPAQPKPQRKGRRGLAWIGLVAVVIMLLLAIAPRMGIDLPSFEPPAPPVEITGGGVVGGGEKSGGGNEGGPSDPDGASENPVVAPVAGDPTETATEVSTLRPSSTATSTSTSTATATPTATANPTKPPTVAPTKTKPKPTSTRLRATNTPTATRTQRPTPTSTAPTVAPPTPVPAINSAARANLLAPVNGLSARDLVQFNWALAYEPAANDCFEVRFWEGSPDNWANGFGIRGHAKETQFQQRFDEALEHQYNNHQLRPGTAYNWGVLLVSCEPYKVQRLISDVRTFTYEGP